MKIKVELIVELDVPGDETENIDIAEAAEHIARFLGGTYLNPLPLGKVTCTRVETHN